MRIAYDKQAILNKISTSVNFLHDIHSFYKGCGLKGEN